MNTILAIYAVVAVGLAILLSALVLVGARSKRNYMQWDDCLLVLAGLLGLSVVWPFVLAMLCGVWGIALIRGRARYGQAG